MILEVLFATVLSLAHEASEIHVVLEISYVEMRFLGATVFL